MTQSIYDIVKGPLVWLIYSDGVQVGGVTDQKKLFLKPQRLQLRLPFGMVLAFKSMFRVCPRWSKYLTTGFQKLDMAR
jgi:hypothetical protein